MPHLVLESEFGDMGSKFSLIPLYSTANTTLPLQMERGVGHYWIEDVNQPSDPPPPPDWGAKPRSM